MTDLLRRELPSTAGATTPAVLLPYQAAWVADTAELKIAEKSRRIGLTWAEASDNVLTAAADRTAGGSNVYYIGYNMDMAIEYIEACAMWARIFDRAAGSIEPGEEIFRDEADAEQRIKTYTIKFPSGFRVVALSSRPANLRGKQGVIVLDEAAFHGQLAELIKAAIALLIWGGKVRVISTHDGDANPFNELIQEVRQGRRAGTVHRIEFMEAVEQGLYQRVCWRTGKDWTAQGQADWIAWVYKSYGDDAAEELDVIPSQGSGAWLPAALIEQRMIDAPVLRFDAPREFELQPLPARQALMAEWIRENLQPVLDALPVEREAGLGGDFGRSQDLTSFAPYQVLGNLTRRFPFLVELRRCPFDQQRQVLEVLGDGLPHLRSVALDGRGIGAQLAEHAADRWGRSIVEVVMATEPWYRQHMPPLKTAFEDGTIEVPRDMPVRNDLRAFKVIRGVPRLPERSTAAAGEDSRHGDAGVAIALGHYASRREVAPIEFGEAPRHPRGYDNRRDDDGRLFDRADEADVELPESAAW